MTRRRWTDAELAFARRALESGMSPADVAARLGRTFNSVTGAVHRSRKRAAQHQILLRNRRGQIALGCACLLGVIEARTRFPAADAIAEWRDWHERAGITL